MTVLLLSSGLQDGRLAACRRSGGIATGCGDWPLPPMAAGSPARVGMAPSSSGRSGRREADAVSRRWWGIRIRCIAWPGARMEARWPVAALTTRSGCGMERRAALGRRYWDIAPWCTAWPSPPTAAACSVAVAMVRCGCGTWNVASRYASCRATGPPSSTSTGVRTAPGSPVQARIPWSPSGMWPGEEAGRCPGCCAAIAGMCTASRGVPMAACWQVPGGIMPSGSGTQPRAPVSRSLGTPIWAAHYLSFQAMFGIPCVLLLGDRELRSPVIVLLYHKLRCITSAPLLPLPSDWLAQRGDDLRSERNPAWSQRRGTTTLQDTSLAPVRNGRDIDIEQLGGSACRVAPISPLSGGCSLRTLRASSRDVIGIANPLDFADRKRASHASLLSFLIEQGSNLGIGVHRRQRSHTLDHLWAGLAFFPRHLVAWNGQTCEGLGLPPNSHIDDIASFRERHIFDQPAHELLALHKGRRRRIPESRQIMGQAADLLALRGGEHQGRLFGQHAVLALQSFHLRQFLVPVSFQAASHQAVVRVDRFVATTSQVRFVLRPFNLTLPLVIDLFGTGFHLVQSRESHFQVGGLEGLQKAGDHSLINAIATHGLAGSRGQLRVELVTFVHQQGAIALIPNTHAPATGATQENPLQERR